MKKLLLLVFILCQVAMASESEFNKIGNNPVIKLDELWGHWDQFEWNVFWDDADGGRVIGDTSHIRFDLKSELYSSNHKFIIRFYRADSFYLGGTTIKGVCGAYGDCSFPGRWKNGKYEIGSEIAKFYTLEKEDHSRLSCEKYTYQVSDNPYYICYGENPVWMKLDSAQGLDKHIIPFSPKLFKEFIKKDICGGAFKDSLGTIPYNPYEEQIEGQEAIIRTARSANTISKAKKTIEKLKKKADEWASCYLSCNEREYMENDSTCSPLPEHAIASKDGFGFECEPGYYKNFKTGTEELICSPNPVPGGKYKPFDEVENGYFNPQGKLVCYSGYTPAIKYGTTEPYCMECKHCN